ncbi:tartrate-resistant acid phosphatase type 5 family protein [Sphingomonas sp.]|uniref:purple acid phosphatase family protein n=1 Tax=Sphingomonas sp. TaxID=28214 RepID=UPI0025E8E357|nr:tartrate-resistant acid phosphatase type 5 family protein [Sphingomonas sp.]
MFDRPVNRRTVIGGMAVVAAAAPFAQAATAASPSFLVVGDWGRDGAQHQRDVAMAMGKAAHELKARFVLSVGDNFYENGVQSANDRQWQTSFEDIYTDPALQVPWHVALGNHDYRGNPQAQLDYAKRSRRWKMPSRYHVLRGADIGMPDTDLFVIDSSPLVHSYRTKVDSQIARNVASQDSEAQVAWLDRALSASRASRKLVVGHHTIRSGGSGHGDTPEMVAVIKPLLERHGVQAYINGHDHDLQHIVDNGVAYLGCGAGSEVRPVKPVAGTKFCVARSGFAAITLDKGGMGVEFRDYAGASLYRTVIARA